MANRDLTARFSASTAGFSTGTNALKQKLTELNTSMEQTKQAVKQANSEIKQYEKELSQLRKETQNGATATNEQRDRMQQLRDNIARTTSQLGTMRTAEQELRSQINSTNRKLQDQQSAAQQVQSAAANMGDVLKANLWSSAIQSAVSRLVSSLKSAAEYCYNVGSSFEAGMSQVAAISGATASEMEQLTAKAKELGASTKFTATETAQAMNYMAMAGWNAEQMLSGIDGVMSLAAASGGDLAQVSDIVTDAITAFGLKAEDVGHFSDVLAAASANANTNVAMMGETFQYCAPIAGALGFSIEDVAEAIGLMANSGIKSSMAGTALRTLFTKLSDDIKITGDSLGEVTIQTSNADGTMRSLTDILTDMRAAFAQLSQSERSNAAESIAGKYAMTGLLALMNSGADDVDKLRTAIEKCDGSSANMADTMQNNVSGAVTIMKSAMEGLGIAVYDKFGEKLKSVINGATDIFSDLTERIESGALDATFERLAQSLGSAANEVIRFASDALPGLIDGLANFISIAVSCRDEIGALITGIATFKTLMGIQGIVKAAVGSINALKAALSGAAAAQQGLNAAASANPFGIVAAAVAVLVGGLVELVSSLDDCNDRMSAAVDNGRNLADSAEDYSSKSDRLKEVRKKYEEITRSTDDAEKKGEELQELQDQLIDQFGDMASGIDLVTGAFDEQAESIDDLIKTYDDLSIQDEQRAITELKNGQKESTAISLDAAGFDMGAYAANQYFVQKAKEYSEYGGFDDTLRDYRSGAGVVYFSGTYGERAEKLSKLREDMIAKYIETGDEAYNELARKLEAQIPGLEQGAEELSALTKRAVDRELGITPDESGKPTVDMAGGLSATAMEAEYNGKKRNQAYQNRKTVEQEKTGIDWTDFDSVKAYYKYLLDTEQIEESEYYDRIEEYNDKLQKDSDPAKWRSTASEIYKGRNKETSGKSGSGSGKDPNEEKYDSEKKYLKWRLDMGYVEEDEYYEQLAALRDKYLDESSDKWRSATLEIHQYQEKKAQETQKAEEDKESERLEKYQSEKEYLKWRLDMGYITEEEYYDNLARLRDKYLDESSEEWRSATLAIHKYQEQKAEEARKAEEQRNKEKLDKITEQYNRAISDINDEIKQHRRDREDEDIDKKIADIDRQLEYDRLDDYSRSQLEKKKQELYDEKAETQWQREHEDLKDELKTVYTMAQDIYENGTAELKSILSVASVVFGAVGAEASQVASTSSTVNNNSVNVVMNAVSQTADQIAGAVVRMISSGI